MNRAWNDDVYRMVSPWHQWRVRLGHTVRCYFHAHVPGVPLLRDPYDPGRAHGPCRHCGGEHYWREGRWVMQQG